MEISGSSNASASDPIRVVSFQARRAEEMESLVARHGGVCFSAPAMREVALPATPAAWDLVERLRASSVDLLVLLTGVGVRAMQKAVEARVPQEELVDLFRNTSLLARGPKPVAVLKRWGLRPGYVAGAPNTWRQVLEVIASAFVPAHGDLKGKTVAVQEYGVPNTKLYEALESQGAQVMRVPVYAWAPPDNTGPLKTALHDTAAGAHQVALFSSANQVYSVFEAAKAEGVLAGFRAGLAKMLVASVGPVCTEALVAHDIRVDVEPEITKMGHMVRAALKTASDAALSKTKGEG